MTTSQGFKVSRCLTDTQRCLALLTVLDDAMEDDAVILASLSERGEVLAGLKPYSISDAAYMYGAILSKDLPLASGRST